MDNKLPESGEQADDITSDLDALRALDSADIRPGWLRQFALLLLLVTAFVVIVWFTATRTSNGKPVVFNAGVDFVSESGASAWMGPALDQAMVATIQSGEQLRLINPISTVAAYSVFGSSTSSALQSQADYSLHTTLAHVDADAVIAKLSLTRIGEQSATFNTDVLGSANAIGDLAARSANQIFAWLELDGVSPKQLGYASNEVPSRIASELYGKGLVALAAGDGHTAREHFENANDVATENAAIHEGLANAWELLGYAENATSESLLALQASGKLSRRRQLELEAKYALRSEAWDRAEQVFAALKEFNPDNLDYRLAIADSRARQNNNIGFAASIEEMRAMGSAASEDPRIDLVEAEFWYRSGDYGQCFQLAGVAEEKATLSGDNYIRGEALLSAGRCDDTFDADILNKAREVFRSLKTRIKEPEILRELAKHEFSLGNMQSYLDYSEEALKEAMQLGNEPEVAAAQNALATAYDLRGWLSRGYELKTRVAQYQKQRNNLNRYSIMLENIGVSLFKLGRYDEAEIAINQAEEIFRKIDDKIGIAWLPYRRGQIALRRGQLSEARKYMTQALENADDRPEGGLAIESTYELGLIAYFSGDFDAARQALQETNQYFRDQEISVSVAESEIALARLAFSVDDNSAALEHLAVAEQNLSNDIAYYSMSLRTEQLNFALPVAPAVRKRACSELENIVDDQEHREYLLRAKAKIVACRGLLGEQPYAVSHAMLVAVEEEARRLNLFEAQLTAGYVRVALLHHGRRSEDATVENSRLESMANSRQWQVHPVPDLEY